MRKLLFFSVAFILLFCARSQAQTARYRQALQKLESMGYTISKEMMVNISEGQTGYSYKTFYEGLTYIIYAMSEDGDVQDIDVYVYDTSDDGILKRDTEADDIAVVSFTPGRDIEGKVVIKNYKSDDPKYESKCRYIIAYKSE